MHARSMSSILTPLHPSNDKKIDAYRKGCIKGGNENLKMVGLINKAPSIPGGIAFMQVASILKSEGVAVSAWVERIASDLSH